MKKTRNMILLVGTANLIEKVLPELQFKGSVIVKDPINYNEAREIFNNNKSIISSAANHGIEYFHESPIYVEVSTGHSFAFTNYINVNAGNITAQFQDIISRNNLDIGDHKSNSSGMNGIPTISDCDYCKVFNHQTSKYQHKVLYKSKSFYVLATVGEFVKGYLLIIPKRHIMSMAELTEDERAEFLIVLGDVKSLLNLTYGYKNFLVWENGTGNSGKGKAKDSVVHSHVHIAPSKLNATQIAKMSGIHLDKISYSDLPKYNLHSYLLIAGKNTNEWFINNNPNMYIPRQFVRQILGEEHGILGEAWNWRIYPFIDLMEKVENDILSAIKDNFDILPDRMKECTKDYIS